jgi:hypothetical protein
MSNFTFEIPRVNPLRLWPLNSGVIDYDTVMPRFDLMSRGEKYQPHENPVNVYPDWVVNQTLYFQIHASHQSLPSEVSCQLIKDDGVIINCTVTLITPVGWVGYPVFQISTTPLTSGLYYLYARVLQTFPNNYIKYLVLRSDTFYVNENLSTSKKLVELQFKNSVNNMGMVWNRYYKAYYTAIFKESDGEQENSVFKVDSGTNMLNSKDYGGIDVTFTDIQKRYKRTIEKQLRCDSILFNGMECICEANPTSEDTENADVININARLTFKNSDDLLTLY